MIPPPQLEVHQSLLESLRPFPLALRQLKLLFSLILVPRLAHIVNLIPQLNLATKSVPLARLLVPRLVRLHRTLLRFLLDQRDLRVQVP